MSTSDEQPVENVRPDRCATCRFWDKEIDQESGLCRRHAPRPALMEGENCPKWPRTSSDEWCGEWSPVTPPGPSQAQVELLGKSVAMLDLPAITTRALMSHRGDIRPHEIQTIGELVNCTAFDLMERPNFGSLGLERVREALAGLGLKLKGD